MISKAQIEKENRELREEVRVLKGKQIPCGQHKFHCPDCGNPVLVNDGAYARRNNKTFYCSVGHPFTISN